jgi:hypothetical protein
MSFKRLNQKRFHGEHDRHEGESISQDARDVEQLERDPDLEADTVGRPSSSTISTTFQTRDRPERAAAARYGASCGSQM